MKEKRRARAAKAVCTALLFGVVLFGLGAGTGWPLLGPATSRAAQAADADDVQSVEQPAGDGQTEGASNELQDEATAPVVRSIRIRGNEQVSAETIFAAIQATRVGEPFSQEDVMADFQSIYNLGYFTPDITADIAPDGDGVSVIFQVTEFLIEDIRVSAGDELEALLDPGEVSASFSLQPGDVVDPVQLNQDLLRMTDLVWSEFGVLVQPDSPSITQDGVVTVNLVPVRVRNIEVEGNEKTLDYVIFRELNVKPGSIVRRDQITEDGYSVLRLGYFTEVVPEFRDVPLDVAQSSEAPSLVDLVFKVEERKTGEATFGAGWSSQGLMGQVSVADDNFLGRGERVHLSAEFGKERTTYSLGFYEPYLTDAGTSFGFNLYNERETYEDDNGEKLEDRTTGGDVSLGRPLGEYTRGDVTYRVDGSTIAGTTRSLTFGTRTDTSDHPFFPTEGFRTNLSAELAGGVLGGDNSFNKYQAEMVKYLRVGSNDQSLAFRLRGGVANAFGGDLPIQEKFRVGGSDTVRGYDYGTEDGTTMLVGNAEYRFDLTDGIQGVVFTDVGDAWESADLPAWDEMKKSAGLGVRLDTPIGILRIDYGWGEEGGKASFSLGPSF